MGVSEAYKELVIKVEKFKAGMQVILNNKSINID
jgi:hypothetical protein